MASTEREVQKPADVSAEQPENVATDKLTDALAKVEIEDQDSSSVVNEEKESQQPPRPLHIYTRVDALTLSKSPLVTLPDGMPSLKDWFGYVKFATCILHTSLMALVYSVIGMNSKCLIRKRQRTPVLLQPLERDGPL